MMVLVPRVSARIGVNRRETMLTADIAASTPAAATRDTPSNTASGTRYTMMTAWPTHPRKWMELMFQYALVRRIYLPNWSTRSLFSALGPSMRSPGIAP